MFRFGTLADVNRTCRNEPPPMPRHGLLLRQAREAVGLSRAEVEAAIGVSHPTLLRWENGERNFSFVRAWQLARVIKCPTDAFGDEVVLEAWKRTRRE